MVIGPVCTTTPQAAQTAGPGVTGHRLDSSPIALDLHTSVTAAGPWGTNTRRLIVRHIVGSGLELGPGHVPFPAQPGTTVRVVDRWRPEENHELFPELADAEFTVPDVVADLNTDRLSPVADASQDFVICSHVLEHLAEPIGLLDDIHRVLRPGGVLLLFLPDRHRTFDRHRDPTPLEHLVAEHQAGVTEVDDDHVVEYLAKAEGALPDTETVESLLAAPPDERRAKLDLERRRSIHVHCWDDEEFFPVLLYGVEHLGWRWEFVDGILTEDELEAGIEFGFLLRVSLVETDPGVLRDRLDHDWRLWRDIRMGQLTGQEIIRQRALTAEAELKGARERLERIDASPPMQLYHLARRVTRPRGTS